MNDSSRSARASAEAERLREVFAEAGQDLTPSAVPLRAIERAGRRRLRRRRAAVLGAACGGLLVPLTLFGFRDGSGPDPARSVKPSPSRTASASPSPSAPAPTVRTVAPGERVRVASGIRIWLTPEGKHWSEPDQPDEFRSAVDGNLDLTRPGLSLQSSGQDDGRVFYSGIFYGPGTPSRVEMTTDAGPVAAVGLTLPGRPGWGVWYALTERPVSADGRENPADTVSKVTVYDAKGRVIAKG
ncbi:hypothetical protein B0675_09750 [Streptomyces sp. M41(2017)]|uniref:hypothetical protein n=1 Tax=unclassified Streptomyces TaxID=2593676 RepID=UPI0009BF9CF2|nr:hypothetical protein [Streptomyces sp. M41(2017)]OQQ17371.1 hypothetical protein B0675_09750 [Streptomyces sp. M41(2017)]